MVKIHEHKWKRNPDYTYTCEICGFDIINGTPEQYGCGDVRRDNPAYLRRHYAE
jgi:hypothetical protein